MASRCSTQTADGLRRRWRTAKRLGPSHSPRTRPGSTRSATDREECRCGTTGCPTWVWLERGLEVRQHRDDVEHRNRAASEVEPRPTRFPDHLLRAGRPAVLLFRGGALLARARSEHPPNELLLLRVRVLRLPPAVRLFARPCSALSRVRGVLRRFTVPGDHLCPAVRWLEVCAR